MAEVKWIKLSTSMFDDEKIRLIEQMPDADTILVIWVKLLAQAGKTNSSGYIFLNENIPYTDEMLSTIFSRPLATIRLALKVFEDLGMIGIDDNSFISISNWGKHQSVDRLAEIREKNRLRQAKFRDKQQVKQIEESSNVTVTSRNALDIELDKELELDKDKTIVGQPDIPYKKIVDHLNNATNKNYRHSTKKTKDLISSRWNEGFTLEDFKKVIDVKSDEWKNSDKWSKYLQPTTLFGNKFEGYLNQESSNDKTGYDPNRDAF